MKTVAQSLAVASTLVLALAGGRAAAGEPVAALLDPYFRIQAALADDRNDGIKADTDLVAAAAADLGAAGDPMAAAARALGAAATLSDARNAFARLSEALIVYVEAARAGLGDEAVTVYCPMLRKRWVQQGDKVRNPYFGKGMLGCGEIKKRG